MSTESERQMEGLSPDDQARKAIRHVLSQIRDRPEVGWYLGACTQTFALLTEALSTLDGLKLEAVEALFECHNAKNPAVESAQLQPEDNEEKPFVSTAQCIEYLADLPPVDRMELLQMQLDRFCPHCGADRIVRVGRCGCRGAFTTAPRHTRRQPVFLP